MRTAETTTFKNGVLYVVHEGPGKTIWVTFVRFGRRKFDRPGGPAFQNAAREQERAAGVPCDEVMINKSEELYI